LLALALLFVPEVTLLADVPACEGAIVYRSGSEAYAEAVAGIREKEDSLPCMLRYLDLENPAYERWFAGHASNLRFAVAIGIGTYRKTASTNPNLTVIPAIVLHDDLNADENRWGAVYADVPLVTMLENLRGLFPSRLRAALIHKPGHALPDVAALARIRRMGYELRVVDCAGPEKLLAVFSSLKGTTDFVIAEPDPDLYNSATIKPLVLESLSRQLPILGFSATFVRAGALVGVYPDFKDLGRQTGELVARILQNNGSPRADAEVRDVVVMVNTRVARMLGLEPARREGVLVLK
jgi:hypothetical protein